MNKINAKKVIAKIYQLEAKAEALTNEVAIPMHHTELFTATGPIEWKEYKRYSKRKFKTLKQISKKLRKIEILNNSLPVEKRIIIPMCEWRKEEPSKPNFGDFVKDFHW